MKYSSILIGRRTKSILILVVVFLAASVSTLQVFADVLSQEEKKALTEYPSWVASDSSCSSDLGAAGSGKPDGTTFPNLDPSSMANAIDTYIQKTNPQSLLKGLGSTIVASSKQANINPFLIVAIASKESSLADPSDFNVSHGSNSFGRSAAPGQPSFQGARAWYKWSSVKASVDYTAPENKNASGGGDEAAYISQNPAFKDAINSNDFTKLFMTYAPPGDGNNTTQYIKDVKSWIAEMVALANKGSSGATAPSSTDTNCSSAAGGAVIGDIVKTAINYSWPDYHPAPYLIMRPSYKAAIERAQANNEYVGGLNHPGVDCGGFVTRVMRDSGADPNYNWGPGSPKQGPTPAQQAYMDAHPEKYQRLGPQTSTANLQPGDIAINSEHTYIYVGKQAGFNGNSASASVLSWRTPMASNAYFSNSAGSFLWYRLK